MRAGEHVGSLKVRHARLRVCSALQVHHPGDRVDQVSIGLHRAQRTGLPEARDRAIDQAGTHCLQRCRVQTVARHHARREVLDHDVGDADQVEHHLVGLGVGEIDRDAALTYVQAHEIAALIGPVRLELPDGISHFVAFAGPLDLDYASAQVREQAGAVWPRQDAGEVQDGQAGEERLAGVGRSSWGHDRRAEGVWVRSPREYSIMTRLLLTLRERLVGSRARPT